MNIVVISDNYPSDQIPNKGAFVYNLMQYLIQYHNITVIAPFKRHELLKKKSTSGYGKENCEVLRPLYFSFSNINILGFNSGKWSSKLKNIAVNKALNNLDFKPDLIYAHFLQNAASSLDYVKKNKTPLVIASGESTYKSWQQRAIKRSQILEDLKECTQHLICVAETNQKSLLELGFSKNKMTIVPNAVNYDLFKPLNKEICKEKLGIPKNKFVVGFIGYFIHRKGPERIIQAIESLKDNNIQFVAIGSGGKLPHKEFVRIMEPVSNYQLPDIYNAFDIFVLPTLNEGHCNVIEEAKACGIPIVSSLGTSVETQIDDTTGILLNPLNINEIAKAIKALKNDDKRRDFMAENLKAQRGSLSLKNRAKKISVILNKVIEN